jgi:hypothetical protein
MKSFLSEKKVLRLKKKRGRSKRDLLCSRKREFKSNDPIHSKAMGQASASRL